MSKKRDWKKECDELNIPYEVIDGKIYLWPEFRKSNIRPWGLEPQTLRQVYNTIRDHKAHLNKTDLKEQDHRKERAKTRQMIYHEKEFPTGKVHYEDPWSHD